MYSQRVIALVVLLASFVAAVDIGTAFVRDYVKYLTPGFLEAKFIAADEFVALEGDGVLTRRKITNEAADNSIDSDLVWAVDLRPYESELLLLQYHVGSNSVFAYGPHVDLTVVDLDDGTVSTVGKAGGKVNWVKSAPSGNVYAITDAGALLAVNDDSSARVIDLGEHGPLDGASTIRLASVGDIDYLVLSSGHVLKLSDSVVSIGQIPGIRGVVGSTLVAGNNHVFAITSEQKLAEIKHLFNRPTVLNDTVLVDIEGSKLVFYKINSGKAETIGSREEGAPVSDAYSISNGVDIALAINLGPINLKVLILTEFLNTGLPDSVREFTRGSAQELGGSKKSSLFSSSSTLLTSFVENSNLFVESTNWLTGEQYHGAIYKITVDPKSVLIVDKPNVATESLELALLATESSSILLNWFARTKRHLTAIGKFVSSIVIDHKLPTDDHSGLFPEVDFGFDKLVLFFDPNSCRVHALNSKDGSLEWTTESFCTASDSNLLGMFIANQDVVVTLEQHVHRFNLHDGLRFGPARFTKYGFTDAIKLKAENGRDTWVLRKGKDFTRYGPFDVASNQVVITEENGAKLQAYISVKGKLVPTWTFGSDREKILKYIGKPEESTTSSIGVVLHDKSVLYKYLYPNTVSVITSDEEGILTFYLLDGVKGEILYSFKHKADEVVDVESVEILMDDNWVVYSYFIFEPRFEQRIVVLDLFDSSKLLGTEEISAFDADLKISNVSQQAFTYPDRINKLKSTVTNHGITLKSVIALTENGALVEFPKWVLNSRRVVGRDMTKEDMMSDFRPLQYEPVVPRNTKQILNHKYKIFVDNEGTILTKGTSLESTSVVCYINSYNLFCSTAQPSRSWDLLGSGFDKNKLALTILILIMSYVTSTVFVSKKSVHDAWHDSS